MSFISQGNSVKQANRPTNKAINPAGHVVDIPSTTHESIQDNASNSYFREIWESKKQLGWRLWDSFESDKARQDYINKCRGIAPMPAQKAKAKKD